MPWMEIELSPGSVWNDHGLEDWAQALGAFLIDRGTGLNPKVSVLPGLNILQLGEEGSGEITLSGAERLVILDGLSLEGTIEGDFVRFVVSFARQMGAVGVCASINSPDDQSFWREMGGVIRPDPVPLEGSIVKERVGVRQLSDFSLLVTYEDKPALCLEPISCNAHAPGLISLSQRRLEKIYGGSPLGFASRVAVHCPWKLNREHWDDLLSFSRLQSFDLLEELVNINRKD